MLVPPHFLVSTAFKKMGWKDEFRKWLPKLSIVCVFSSHSFWTSSSLDVPAGVTQEEGHTGGRSHRIFHPPSFCGACLNFSREKDSAIPFPRATGATGHV